MQSRSTCTQRHVRWRQDDRCNLCSSPTVCEYTSARGSGLQVILQVCIKIKNVLGSYFSFPFQTRKQQKRDPSPHKWEMSFCYTARGTFAKVPWWHPGCPPVDNGARQEMLAQIVKRWSEGTAKISLPATNRNFVKICNLFQVVSIYTWGEKLACLRSQGYPVLYAWEAFVEDTDVSNINLICK